MSDDPDQGPTDGPQIDGRRSDQLETDVRENVPYYVDEWDPDEGDVGSTLLSLFGELAAEVTERLDRVPEKHRVSFYETLGFDRQPPKPARLPISIDVADGADENVSVPTGTVAAAEASDGSEQPFEVPSGESFDATPANLMSVFSVDPDRDAIYNHDGTIGGDGTTTLFEPVAGENLQKHRLYVGDSERLSVSPGSKIQVVIDTDAEPEVLRDSLRWEYYGEREIGGETVEGWHPFPSTRDAPPSFSNTIQTRSPSPRYAGRWSDPSPGFEAPRYVTDPMAEYPTIRTGRISDDLSVQFERVTSPPSVLGDIGTETRSLTAGFETGVREARTLRNEASWMRYLFELETAGVAGEQEPPWMAVLRNVRTTRNEDGDAVLEFAPDGTLTETAIDGTESKWIRCSIPESTPDRSALFDLGFGEPGSSKPPLEVGAGADDLRPDMMLHNDVPLPAGSDSDTVQPFGAHPRFRDTFAIASTDALTKPGAGVTITFQKKDAGSGNPVLSWEYFDGEGWSRIPGVDDGTDGFTSFDGDGVATVTFESPGDLSETTVAGHRGHWIRARLVGGNYGDRTFVGVDLDEDEVPDRYVPQEGSISPPGFAGVRLSYDQTEPPDHAVGENNLGFGDDVVAEERRSFSPFERIPVDEQTLFLGFDGQLRDGPINVLVDVADAAYRADFYPRVRWEYVDPGTGEWTEPGVLDGTEGMTERGIVGITFPADTEETTAFGRDRHWVRARVTGASFEAPTKEGADIAGGGGRDDGACGRYVETVPPAGEPGRDPPTVRGLYSNAAWVRNRETVADETLGSSDGGVVQSFRVANTPVVDIEVWVDELAGLSEGRRRALAERWPDRTDTETDASGEPIAFWVRWEKRDDLLDSGADERHYTLDPIDGSVSFGDGKRGRIPPRGTDNVRASYTTGGGEAGNVPAGSVSGFRQSLAFVEGVTNPLAGDAGADAEPTDAVTDRAARELRDRNRAVAPADVERIAMDASRRLAQARCLPAMNRAGDYSPGWVTLLVVPASAARKPTPSATLRQEVEKTVAERAPVTLVDLDQLVVRGPSYVAASVDVELAATGGSISALEAQARASVESFLHPLTGGPAGDGWPFGELPCRSALVELLEGVERVDHVIELTVTFETSRSTVTVAEGEATPDTSPDALVYGGTHEVAATLAGGGER